MMPIHKFILAAIGSTTYLQSIFLGQNVRITHAFDVPYPSYRFRDFSTLTSEEMEAAKALGYDEESWNHPGTAEIEYESWWMIENDYYDYDKDGNTDEPHPIQFDAATTLGFEEEGWDCWQNHYNSYPWEELTWYELDIYWGALGWTEDLWDNYYYYDEEELPASNEKYWDELSTEEKTAALHLCYTQKLWDDETLPFCEDSTTSVDCDWFGDDLDHERCLTSDRLSRKCRNTCGTCDDEFIDIDTESPTVFRVLTTYAPAYTMTSEPTVEPTSDPTVEPTSEPTADPTIFRPYIRRP